MPAREGENVGDVAALHLGEGQVFRQVLARHHAAADLAGQVAGQEAVACAENDGPLEDVSQLADVAWPGVASQQLARLRADAAGGAAGPRYEVMGNVDATITLQGKPAKTISAAEFAKANGKVEIAMP